MTFAALSNQINDLQKMILNLATEFRNFKEEFLELKKDVANLKDFINKNMVYRYEFEGFKVTVLTREEFLERMASVDEIVGEIRDSRNSRLLYEGHFVDVDNRVHDHERRIVKLEKASR
jgi:hypothetical protein